MVSRLLICWMVLSACGGTRRTTETAGFDPAERGREGSQRVEFREVTVGQFHSCGITANGRVSCWGGNEVGQVGDGTTTNRTAPVWVRGLQYTIDVDAGAWQTCAITDGGGASCWGGGRPGTVLARPARLSGVTGGVIRSIAVGQVPCALDLPGRAFCWRGTIGERAQQPTLLPTTGRGQVVDVGIDRVCVLLGLNQVECFRMERGTGINSSMIERFVPFEVQPAVRDIRNLTVSGSHACFIGNGKLFCWGSNEHGQLGDGTTTPVVQPVEVYMGDPVADATAGWRHTCGVTTRGLAACWGDNTWGQLGNGNKLSSRTPVPVVGIDEPVIRVAAGMGHTCAVTMARRIYCWGLNQQGQLGTASRENRLVPTPVVTDLLERGNQT